MKEKQTTPFTKEQVSQYVDSQGTRCPVCGGAPVHFNREPEFDPSMFNIIVHVVCFNCQTRWQDVYSLTSAVALDETLRPVEAPAPDILDKFEHLDTYEEDEDRYTWGLSKE